MMELILAAIQAIAALAGNPVVGLNEDGQRIADLLSLLAKIGQKGTEAIPELKAFTAEINDIIARDVEVSPEKWDELTARRHKDLERIRAV